MEITNSTRYADVIAKQFYSVITILKMATEQLITTSSRLKHAFGLQNSEYKRKNDIFRIRSFSLN